MDLCLALHRRHCNGKQGTRVQTWSIEIDRDRECSEIKNTDKQNTDVKYSRHQHDLTWSVQSAPLICQKDSVWPAHDWFENYPSNRTITIADIAPGKLGRYFEHLMQSWIQSEPSLTCLAANLPVRVGGKTLGEFDLIVDNAGAIEHWEVAVKFYMAIGDSNDMNQWFGPNPTDTLSQKYERMKTHQLVLSTLPDAQTLLAEQNWQVEKVRSLVKGRLFHPFDRFESGDIALPKGVNPKHEKGWWISATDFSSRREFKDSLFKRLPKSHWLAPLRCEDSGARYNFEELKTAIFAQDEDEQHSGTMHVAEVDEFGLELSRGFIVRQRWLDDIEEIQNTR